MSDIGLERIYFTNTNYCCLVPPTHTKRIQSIDLLYSYVRTFFLASTAIQKSWSV